MTNTPNLLPETPLERAYGLRVKCFQTGINGQYDSLMFRDGRDSWLCMKDAPHLGEWR